MEPCANTYFRRQYEYRQSEAERLAEYRDERINEVEADAVDYFGGDLLNLDGCDDEERLLALYEQASEADADVMLMTHKQMALALFGQSVVRAIDARRKKLSEQYVDRELEL